MKHQPRHITLHAALLAAVLVCVITSASPAAADEPATGIYPPRVAVISGPEKSPPLAALSNESVAHIIRAFNALGRLLPEENNRIAWALGSVKSEGIPFDRHVEAAGLLKSDLLVSVSFVTGARINYADLRIRALNPEYRFMEKSTRIRSRILQNIPLKLAREIARLHEGLPVKAKVAGSAGDGLFVINAGEWNGLSAGRITTSRGAIDVKQAGMYHSLVSGDGLREGDLLEISAGPGPGKLISSIDERLEKNTVRIYGLATTLLKNQDDEGRFVAGTCVINPGGNLCLGGYGAFLSTHYLGFQNPSPATGGIVASTAAYAVQLALVPAMSRFRANFFPWVRDSDKPERLQHLHAFLWCSMPLTFSAGYFDQLAYQFARTEHLPPFFLYRDNMAAILSLTVPGGGLFYKGHRLAGWSYFVSEMGLAGYAVYNWERGNRGRYALAGLGIIKAIEVLNAYFMPVSFGFFNMEMEREMRDFSFNFEMRPHGRDEAVYDLAVERRF